MKLCETLSVSLTALNNHTYSRILCVLHGFKLRGSRNYVTDQYKCRIIEDINW